MGNLGILGSGWHGTFSLLARVLDNQASQLSLIYASYLTRNTMETKFSTIPVLNYTLVVDPAHKPDFILQL